jgi:hypothetical protein
MNTSTIPKPEGTFNLIAQHGDTFDIIQSVLTVINDKKAFDEVSKFVHANMLTSRKVDLKRLWSFVHDKITYVEDGDKQYTQYPSNLIHGKCPTGEDTAGDCKSKTAFIVACLRVMAEHDKSIQAIIIRFCTYAQGNQNVTHVYPCAIVDGEFIIIDAVWHDFNLQKQPMFRKTDKVINLCGKPLKGFLKSK